MTINQNDDNAMYVRELWDRYTKDFPPNLPPNLFGILQKTFYSGFVSGAGTVISSLSQGDKEKAIRMILNIKQELDTFDQLVKMKVV